MGNYMEIENRCNQGCIWVTSKNIKSINGTSYPNTDIYKNKGYAELVQHTPYIEWDKDFEISNDFLLRIRMSTVRTNENFCILGDKDKGNYIELRWLRDEIDRNDCFGLYAYVNGGLMVVKYSNDIPLYNNLSDILVWVKKKNDNYELILTNYKTTDDVPTRLFYESESIYQTNIEYDKHWSMVADDTAFYVDSETHWIKDDERFYSINTLFPIKKVRIRNGIFKNINISTNTDLEYDEEIALNFEWNFNDSIMNCNFDNNINAGSLDKDIEAVVVKHRDLSLSEYSTVIYSTGGDFSVGDPFVKTGHTYEYIIGLLYENGTFEELEYIGGSSAITINLNAVYISDRYNTFKLYCGVTYNSFSQKNDIGIFTPLGTKYPVLISNGQTNYMTGNVSGDFYGYSYERTRRIIPNDVVAQVQDFKTFLANGKAKFISDWNGNAWIVKSSDDISIEYDQSNYGIAKISFSFVEQGDYNSPNDIFEIGLARGLEKDPSVSVVSDVLSYGIADYRLY